MGCSQKKSLVGFIAHRWKQLKFTASCSIHPHMYRASIQPPHTNWRHLFPGGSMARDCNFSRQGNFLGWYWYQDQHTTWGYSWRETNYSHCTTMPDWTIWTAWGLWISQSGVCNLTRIGIQQRCETLYGPLCGPTEWRRLQEHDFFNNTIIIPPKGFASMQAISSREWSFSQRFTGGGNFSEAFL